MLPDVELEDVELEPEEVPVDGDVGVEVDPPDVEVDPPGVEVDPPGVEVDPPGVEVDPPGVEVDPPGVEVDPPGVEVDPPDVATGGLLVDELPAEVVPLPEVAVPEMVLNASTQTHVPPELAFFVPVASTVRV